MSIIYNNYRKCIGRKYSSSNNCCFRNKLINVFLKQINTMYYKDEIRKLITELYYPGEPGVADIKYTLQMIKNQLGTVIPENAFDVYDVKEILDDLGFVPKYEQKSEVFYREIPNEFEDDGTPMREKDVVYFDDFVYYYYFQKIE